MSRYFMVVYFSLLFLAISVSCVPTAPTLVARETYLTIPSLSPNLYTSPQIWVARGLVECGPSLYANPCSTVVFTTTPFPFTYRVSYEQSVAWLLVTTQYYNNPVGITSDRFSPTISTGSFTPPSTSMATSSILAPRRWSEDAAPIESDALSRTTPATVQRLGLPNPTHLSNNLQEEYRTVSNDNLQHFALNRRADYDVCFGIPQGSDFKTNSLAAVCNFVDNIQDSFVSLAPNEAAFMPSWFDYLVSFLITIVSTLPLLLRFNEPETERGDGNTQPHSNTDANAFKVVFTIASLVFATTRASLALYRIQKYAHSLESIPYITPLLWTDWLPLLSLWKGRIRFFALAFMAGLWLLSAWLFFGYVFLEYGKRQYEVLEMSTKCEPVTDQLGISWEADPRRTDFFSLHLTFMLTGATAGFWILWLVLGSGRLHSTAQTNVGGTTTYGEQIEPPEMGNRREYLEGLDIVVLPLNLALLLILVGGMIKVGIMNDAEYLLLFQNDCYASYVSTRTTFLGVDFRDWPAKLGAWLGMTV